MGKTGRHKGRRTKGYFYRKGRGWVASDEGRMVPLTFPDGTRIRERQVEDTVLREAHARWLLAKQSVEEAAQQALHDARQVTVEQVCFAYLADAKINGAEQTFEVRADTLFDFCFGLPARFRSKDGTPTPLTRELREAAAQVSWGASKPATGRRFKTSQLGSCLVM